MTILSTSLCKNHGLVKTARHGLKLREQLGETGWHQLLAEYFQAEALVYVTWARQMKGHNKEHELILLDLIRQLEGSHSPIRKKLNLLAEIQAGSSPERK